MQTPLTKEAPVGIEPTNSRFAVCRLTTWPRRRTPNLTARDPFTQARPSAHAPREALLAPSARVLKASSHMPGLDAPEAPDQAAPPSALAASERRSGPRGHL